MTRTIKLFFLFTLFAAFSSCSTVKAKKPVAVLQPANLSFIQLASFFPKDTYVVGRFRIDQFTDSWFPMFSEQTTDPEMNALMKKRNKTFRELLKNESMELIGIDISDAKEIVFAVGTDGAVLAVQGSESAQPPVSKKLAALAHVRVVGNTVLFYEKSSAESLIKNEGLDAAKLKSIVGNAPLVLHLLNPTSLTKEKPISEFTSATLTLSTQGLVRLSVEGDSASLNLTAIYFDKFMEGITEKMETEFRIESPTTQFLSDTFFKSFISNRIDSEHLEVKALLPRMFAEISPATLGVASIFAVPAFQKYIKSSKAAEARGTLARMKSSIQSTGLCNAPTLPATSSEIPSGGVKVVASFDDPNWAPFGMTGSDGKMYFSYRVEKLTDKALRVFAETDFDVSSKLNHTISFDIVFGGKSNADGTCEVSVSPNTVKYEFE